MFSILYFLGKLFSHEVKSANAAAYASRPDVRAKYMGEDMNTRVHRLIEEDIQQRCVKYGITREQYDMWQEDVQWADKEISRVSNEIFDRPSGLYTSFERVMKRAEFARAKMEIEVRSGLYIGGIDRYQKYDSSWTPEMRRDDAWRMYQEMQEREQQQAKQGGLR